MELTPGDDYPGRHPDDDIFDANETAVVTGTGELLSPESYKVMISTDLRGKDEGRLQAPSVRRPR